MSAMFWRLKKNGEKWGNWRLTRELDGTNVSFISHIHVRFLSSVISFIVLPTLPSLSSTVLLKFPIVQCCALFLKLGCVTPDPAQDSDKHCHACGQSVLVTQDKVMLTINILNDYLTNCAKSHSLPSSWFLALLWHKTWLTRSPLVPRRAAVRTNGEWRKPAPSRTRSTAPLIWP